MTTQPEKTDVVVVGAGPIGLTTALGLANIGCNTTIIGPPFSPDPERPDTRTTAVFNPGLQLLRNLGIWSKLAPCTQPLEAIRIIDDMGGLVRASDTLFEAREIGQEVFGANIINADLVVALHAAIADHPLAKYIESHAAKRVSPSDTHVTVETAEGGWFQAPLIVGCDGRSSICRDAAGISKREWVYKQTALVCSFSHSAAHNNVSTEFHRPAGPFTVVPVAPNRSSLVWVERPEIADSLKTLSKSAFLDAVSERLHGLLGTVSDAGPRGAFPLSGLSVRLCAAKRIMLAGESAHVMPPIGAQGLNLGYRDIGQLLDLVQAARDNGEDLGAAASMDTYNKARQSDVTLRTTAVDLLNKTLLNDIAPVQLLRQVGMRALSTISPLRRYVIRQGMAPTQGIARSMKPGWRASQSAEL